MQKRMGDRATSSGNKISIFNLNYRLCHSNLIIGRSSGVAGQPLPRSSQASRFKISPTSVLIFTVVYMGLVVVLHIFSKITASSSK